MRKIKVHGVIMEDCMQLARKPSKAQLRSSRYGHRELFTIQTIPGNVMPAKIMTRVLMPGTSSTCTIRYINICVPTFKTRLRSQCCRKLTPAHAIVNIHQLQPRTVTAIRRSSGRGHNGRRDPCVAPVRLGLDTGMPPDLQAGPGNF